MASYDPAAGRVAIEVRTEERTRVVRRRKVALPGSFRLGFALCESQVTVLADTGDGWRPLLTEREKVRVRIDLRVPSTLAAHRYAWSGDVGRVRWGPFGMTGLRDQHLVQHSDGTPYVRDGKVYLTATCAGLGFFRQAHWGVFTLDVARPGRLEQVAQLYFRRDGLVLGDHAGQIVRDEDDERWIVATSSWGDFDFQGLHVRHLTTTDDVLHGVHVLETGRTPLPTAREQLGPGDHQGRRPLARRLRREPVAAAFEFHPALAGRAPRVHVVGRGAGAGGGSHRPALRGPDHRGGPGTGGSSSPATATPATTRCWTCGCAGSGGWTRRTGPTSRTRSSCRSTTGPGWSSPSTAPSTPSR